MSNVNMLIEDRQVTFCFIPISMLAIFVAICEIFTVVMNFQMFFDLNNLILKVRVKNVDDLDENWRAKVPCQRAYVDKNCCF